MNPQIEKLLGDIETGSQEEKLHGLIDIGDYVEFEYYKDKEFGTVVQRLVNIAGKETNEKVQRLLFRNISMAYQQQTDLNDIDFNPLIAALGKADSLFICNVLYLLSMTYKSEYIPLIESYAGHADEKVREEAESALSYLKRT